MAESLYIHIPFCQSRCAYCDFYSYSYRESLAGSFLRVLGRQIKNLEPTFKTIYIGGGTPTVLSRGLLKKLLISLKPLAGGVEEFSIEANPESLADDKIKLLLDYGVNRISIGCQSFNDQKLFFLERSHSAKEAEASVEKVKARGFNNISLDLIFGLPNESSQVWGKDLAQAARLPITHLSVYMLTYEKGTRVFKKINQKKILSLPDEKVAFLYRKAVNYLSRKGFKRYEVSNFAKASFSCMHNFTYWKNEPYLGLGPSAVSYLRGVRKKNISSLPAYLEGREKNKKSCDFFEELSALEKARETAALKIRTSEGIDLDWFKKKTGFDLKDLGGRLLQKIEKENLVHWSQDKKKIALTGKGFLFADTVSSIFL